MNLNIFLLKVSTLGKVRRREWRAKSFCTLGKTFHSGCCVVLDALHLACEFIPPECDRLHPSQDIHPGMKMNGIKSKCWDTFRRVYLLWFSRHLSVCIFSVVYLICSAFICRLGKTHACLQVVLPRSLNVVFSWPAALPRFVLASTEIQTHLPSLLRWD